MNGENALLIEEIQSKRESMAQWKQDWKSLQKDWDTIYASVSESAQDTESLKYLARELMVQSNPIPQ